MGIDSFNNFEKNIEKKSLRELEKEKIKLETQVKKEELKNAISQSIINKLNSKQGYKVKKNDILSIINEITTKGNHIKFLKPADKIWPGDIIRIIDGKVFRTHNGNDKIVGIVSEGFKSKEIIKINDKKVQAKDKKSANNDKITPIVKPKTTKAKIGTNTKQTNNLENLQNIIKHEYIIKRTKKGVIMPGPDGHEYIVNTSFDRRFLNKNALSRFKTISNILDIWSYNAHKVAENDAFLDSTKNNINQKANLLIKNLNSAPNDIFENEQKYKNFIKGIFKVIYQVEDDDRDIIDEEDMKKVYNLAINIKATNQEQNTLKIYNLMRVGLTPGDDGDSTIIKEKLSNDLIQTKEFNFIGEIVNKIQNSDKILHQEDIDTILNGIKLPKVDRLTEKEFKKTIKEKLQTTINELNKAQIGQDEKLKEGYEKFLKLYKIDKNKFSFKKYKTMQINSTFARLAKNIILRTTLEASYDRGNQDTTKKGMYADIVGLSESGTTWKRMDYFSIADENIDYAEEIAGTIATSLIPGGLAYVGAKWAFTLGKIGVMMEEGGVLGNSLKTAEFAARTWAGYIGSETYSSLKDKQWHGSLKGYAEFAALDGILSISGKAVKFVNKGEGFKILGKDFIKTDSLTKKIITHSLIAGATTETMINTPKLLEGKDITFNPANWTKEDITLVLMMIATHGAGKGFEKFKAIKGKDGEIKVEENIDVSTEYYQGKKYKYKFENGKWYNIEIGKELKNKPKNIEKIEKNIIKGTASTPVEFYKNPKTGETYTRTLDGTYFNSKGEIVYKKGIDFINNKKIDPDFLQKIEKIEKPINYKWSTEAPIDKDAKSINKDGTRSETKKSEESPETKDTSTEGATTKENSSDKKKIEIKKNDLNLNNTEKITENGLEIKEGKNWRKATAEEFQKFLEKNPKLEKVFQKIVSPKKIIENIKKDGDLLAKIDKTLGKIPIAGKLYDFSTWLLYKNKGIAPLRWIINDIKTLPDIISTMKNGTGKERIKAVLFANKNLSWSKGIGKMTIYSIVPTAIEEIYKLNNVEGYEIKFDGFLGKQLLQDYAANMYLGITGALILEYLNDDTAWEQ